MTFGLVNKTRKVFVNVGAFGNNLAWGFVEEITSNVTQVKSANAADVVPDSQILSKKCAYGTGATLASSAIKNKIIGINSGATFTSLV